ncbi:MAG TPA: M14 family zinc carboxypeptidase [Gemmatimonadaceae bacterium]
MRHLLTRVASLVLLVAGIVQPSGAQTRVVDGAPGPAADLSAARPGRDPRQPIDEEYTRKIHEYTTEPFFLSPLVDYLPASPTVPTPKAVLGDIAGARDNLPYSKEVYAYMRLLASKSPRVKVFSIGHTEEGREMIAVAVASEQLIAGMDANRAQLAKLADPRTINFDDAEAARIAGSAAPVYYITGTIHSTESGAPTALMELAYRLAVDDSPYIQNIRNNLVTLITPIVEVDGRDRMVDLFRWHMAHPGETFPNLLYWGHYVAHDNNRDAMGMTLKLSQNVLDAYLAHGAQVLHDLHESVPYLYDNTVGDGPYNAWLDPLLTNEWQMIGWNNVQEMTRLGMPGVFAHGQFDTWSPGYLMFMAATHNGISRLYETFGNGGTAETLERTLSPSETERTWWRQNPPLPRVQWSLRNNNNYEETGLLVSLNYFANNRRLFLQNFYEKSKRSIQKPRNEGPAAYVLPANDPRAGAQADLLRVLQKQHVEISRATAPFTVTIPARARSARASDSATAHPAASTAAESRQFPAGSYVIRMDQPYSRIADALLDRQYWAPNDPQKTPYDDTGWSFPEGFAVQAVRVTDVKVLDAPMERVSDTVRARGGVSGSGSVFAINHNGDNALATLRYRLRTADFQAAEEPFSSGGQSFARGSFIVDKVSQRDLDAAARELGITVYALPSRPAVHTHPLRAARVAIMHTWASTQTEGWWRQAFDVLGIPYEYISTQDIAKTPDLNAKWDVILFPPTSGNGQAIIEGLPRWRNPMPWKHTPETPNIGTWAQTDDVRPGLGYAGLEKLQQFVARGGVLVGVNNTAELMTQYGLTAGASFNGNPKSRVVGSFLRSTVVDAASPVVYGIPQNLAVYSDGGETFSVSNTRGGGRGNRFGNIEERATGRGDADDADVVQGRPRLDSSNTAPPVQRVEPWQAAPITRDMLRNPLNVIPPDQRPRVVLRFGEQRGLLASGLLDGGSDIAQRPIVVDVPVQKGHVVLFANNPVWRGETIGSYFLVFNTILNWDSLNAGRRVDAQ